MDLFLPRYFHLVTNTCYIIGTGLHCAVLFTVMVDTAENNVFCERTLSSKSPPTNHCDNRGALEQEKGRIIIIRCGARFFHSSCLFTVICCKWNSGKELSFCNLYIWDNEIRQEIGERGQILFLPN